TLFTQFGVLVGTFEYMSPEQAEMNALGVDTRSDIYSLGVLLYELLTGTTPLQQERLREAALDKLVRWIKEEEPPRPSVRLSTSNNLPKTAAARKTEPAEPLARRFPPTAPAVSPILWWWEISTVTASPTWPCQPPLSAFCWAMAMARSRKP